MNAGLPPRSQPQYWLQHSWSPATPVEIHELLVPLSHEHTAINPVPPQDSHFFISIPQTTPIESTATIFGLVVPSCT